MLRVMLFVGMGGILVWGMDLWAADPKLETESAKRLHFTAEAGRFYQIQKAGADGHWEPWGDPIKGDGEVVERFSGSGDGKFRLKELKDQWVLIWRDEFNGKKLDPAKWAREENGYGGGNNENQYSGS